MMSSRAPKLDALRSLINEARLAVDNPNSSPAIAHLMLKKFRARLRAEGLEDRLIATGLNKEIREFLKQEAEDSTPASSAQLDLWPKTIRPLIIDINRERVFVPSLGQFVALVPDEMTSGYAREAGDYLVDKGNETIRIGKLLIDLSKKIK